LHVGLVEWGPVVLNETSKHGEGVFWLVHGHHVAGVIHSKEVKVTVLAHGASSGAIDEPIVVLSSVKVVLVGPLGRLGPGLSASPVADPVLVAGVYEHLDVAVIEHVSNLWHQVGHPIAKEIGVNHLVALNPLAATDTENFLDIVTVQESIRIAEVVAKRWGTAWNTNVVHVEFRTKWVADNGISKDLAVLKGGDIEYLACFLLGLIN